MRNFTNYFKLTKPKIMLLVIILGITGLAMEKTLIREEPFKLILIIIALYLSGGAANALNQYFERRIDARMSRTSLKRPLPQGTIKPLHALIFSIIIGVAGVLLFGIAFNWLTASISLATILFYSLLYTLWLKPRTDLNIVIGGIAGALAPVGTWAAATGKIALLPWLLFLITFFWTPPHFWSLALYYRDDYHKAKLPMFPIVRGEQKTLNQILFYSFIVVAVTMIFYLAYAGLFYLIIAAGLGIILIFKAAAIRKKYTPERAINFFKYTIIYMFALCITIMIDSYLL
jgi:protoheme IX farnesyltransferase